MADTTTIGSHQEIHVGRFSMDRKGLVTGSVQRHRKEAFDQFLFPYLNLDAAPGMGFPCVGVERTYQQPYGIYTYTYEGVDPDHEPDDENTTFELEVTMEEAGIETHPNIEEIERVYGTFDRRAKRFPKFLPNSSAGGSTGLRKGKDAKQKTSPLAGTDSYLCFGMTFKKSYVKKTIPVGVLRGVGCIVRRPPGLAKFPLPAAARHREWLKLAPHIVRRGNCVQIDEQWLMAGRRGIVREIYGAEQLSEEAPDD